MKRLAFCLLAACLSTTPMLFAQAAPERGRGPLPVLPAAEATSAATTFGGTFVFNFTITVKSSLPTSDVITCAAVVELEDGASTTNPIGRSILESASIIATRSSASAATCKVVIPYSWGLTTSTTDMVNLSWTITANPATATTAVGTITRQSSQSIGSIKVPLTGATTTETIAATI